MGVIGDAFLRWTCPSCSETTTAPAGATKPRELLRAEQLRHARRHR